jgi:proteasome lid subunit RPN8/RPN11
VLHDRLPPLIVPSSVLVSTESTLGTFRGWRRAHEGIAYWAGRRTRVGWFVTTCIKPAARTTEGSFQTSAEANAHVIAFLAAHEMELFAQVHSHPGDSVGHSQGDVDGALMPYDGFVSIVVPRYAAGRLRLDNCAVYRFHASSFELLDTRAVREQLVVLPSMKEF